MIRRCSVLTLALFGCACAVEATEFSTLYQERNTFIKEDRTGFVWLYLQK